MVCPNCRTANADDSKACTRCGTSLDLGDVTLPLISAGPVSDAMATVAMPAQATAWSVPATALGEYGAAPLQAGTVIADRYEIVKLLGEGGMGAVYRAHDRELDRVVALKVIRPELARDAQVLQRFKQELILARQVTHLNVIRIFDLGQSEGLRFITMEFIEGEDLASILVRRGKLPAPEAAGFITQVARGLEAAHAQGVVHRDLKPQNIMIDASGKASVMDFGIARSVDASNMTRTGALLGTPTYMSPEQAQGKKVDARSDLYTLGVIFYELLTGKPPFEADNPMATLVRRIQEKPVPPIEIEPSIPKPVNEIVMKMLATKADDRHQTATAILADLDAWDAKRTGRTVVGAPVSGLERGIPFKYVAAALIGLVALAVWLFTHRPAAPLATGPAKSVRVLVGDFRNSTGDAVFDGTLEPTFSLALEGASFISNYSRGEARKVAQRLKPGAALDETTAVLVAKSSDDINYLVTGVIADGNGKYKITARVLDKNGTVLFEKPDTADNKAEVLQVAARLAAPIRKALGEANPKPSTEAFSSSSLEAAQAYARGQELQWDNKPAEAITFYEQAIQADPGMGRAYTGLAVSHRNLRHYDDAKKYFELALSKTARMTEREQYRTRGAYYLFVGDNQHALEEYTALTAKFPADDAGRINLLNALFYSRSFSRAIEEGRKLADANPRNALYRSNAALYAMYGGQFDDAVNLATTAMNLNNRYDKPYVATALSQLAKGQVTEAAATYQKLQALGGAAASTASIGLADIALYEGRGKDAAAILQQGVAKSDEGIQAIMLSEARRGKRDVVKAGLTPGYSFAAARILLESAQEPKALALAKELGARLEPAPRAYARLIEGEAALLRKQPQPAIDLFQQAQKLADTWIGRLLLGRAYLEAGAFTAASSEFDTCEKRKGEATSIFLDELPTFRYYPQVYYFRARAQEGQKSPSAAELYKTFLAIKSKADGGDPMVADAQKRARAAAAGIQ